MSPHTPQEALALFQAAFNAGSMRDLLALYEPEATLAQPDCPPVKGEAAIEATVAPFLARGLTMTMWPVRVVETELGLAMLNGGWNAVGKDPNGLPVRLFGNCQVVMRRQADGTWRYLIDDPGFGIPPPPPAE